MYKVILYILWLCINFVCILQCEYLEQYPNVHLMYTLVTDNSHYVGGTEKGISYITTHAHLPFSFMGWINEGSNTFLTITIKTFWAKLSTTI